MNNITLIVAMDAGGAIGKNNTIPWKSEGDMKHFKQTTTGHAVVMGRKTYESLNKKPLKDRVNIVVTSNPAKYATKDSSFIFVDSIEKALQPRSDGKTIFLIGGSNIYEQGLKYCDKLILTIFSRVLVEKPDTVIPPSITEHLIKAISDDPALFYSIVKTKDEILREDPLESDFKILRIDNEDVIAVPELN